MVSSTKVFLDPFCRVRYSKFYIHGIISEFGKQNVSFSNQYFKELKRDKEIFFAYLALVIVSPNNTTTRIVIDFQDKPIVVQKAYEWSDIYAKININDDLTDSRYHNKLVSIPPGFGIELWGKLETAINFFSNYLKIRSSPYFSWKSFYKDYYDKDNRERLDEYIQTESESNSLSHDKPYVFFISRLWKHQNCIDHTNLLRKKFIETCQQADCIFEGGFKANKKHPQIEEFKNLCFFKAYSTFNYIKKTKESAIVFNTPTVHNCHGWKLGEYLAMGKAIISTPLSNRLPENLVHGKNIHFISSIDEIESAVHLLLNDHDYRKKLEIGAKEYYDKFADPQRVIQRILEGTTVMKHSETHI